MTTMAKALVASVVCAFAIAGCQDGGDGAQVRRQMDMDRDRVSAEMGQQLNSVHERLAEIGLESADATGEAGKARQQAHARLMDERRDLDAQMKEFRLAGQDEWLHTRENVQKSLDGLSARVDRMWNSLTRD